MSDDVPHVRAKDIKQHDAQALAEGYSPWVRAVEVGSVFTFLAGEAWLLQRIWPALGSIAAWTVAGTFLSAYVFADFISGLFHWMGDTWAKPSTPIVGPVFVRPFREHHVDQLAITRHDFLEVNGANCLISLPVLAGTHLLTGPGSELAALFMGTFLFFIFTTNQFHSWAHQEKRPKYVQWLQRWHVILPVEHHQVHHKAPYMKYYCITNGWMNEPLHRVRFFRALEHLVTAVTGLLPRQDDIGETAAQQIVAATQMPIHTEPREQNR